MHLHELSSADAVLRDQVLVATANLSADFTHARDDLLFTHPLSGADAILQFSAGAGGVEAMAWNAELLRMYTLWAHRHNFAVTLGDITLSERGGYKSATLLIAGAYGWLRAESGVHRRQRVSPFDAKSRKHTSFVLLEVAADTPVPALTIPVSDLQIETMRSGGKGGQNVNKVASAVRITHLPTGISAYQASRSQTQNRATALAILTARVTRHHAKARSVALADERANRLPAEFGSQIRNYVFDPYHLVRDLRSNYQTHDLQGILEGDLDDMLRAALVTI